MRLKFRAAGCCVLVISLILSYSFATHVSAALASAISSSKLLYSANGNIIAMNPDGTDSTVIGSGFEPVSSPSGTKIAYSNAVANPVTCIGESFNKNRIPSGIYTMNTDGTGIIDLTGSNPCISSSEPQWSPDGTKIEFTLVSLIPGGPHGIYTMNADGSDMTQVVPYGGQAHWSPDGSELVVENMSNTGNFQIVNADGTVVQNLNIPNGGEAGAFWSPDGSTLIVDNNIPEYIGLGEYAPDGTYLTSIPTPQNIRGITGIAWSPDGSQLAFCGINSNGDTNVFIMNADGSEVNQLTNYVNGNGGCGVLSWGTIRPVDTTPPVLSLPSPVTVDATSPQGASVNYTVTATDPDNTPSELTIDCSPSSGSIFPIGTTLVNCIASDPAGNTAIGSFTITIIGATGQAQNLQSSVVGIGPGGSYDAQMSAVLQDLNASPPNTMQACIDLKSFISHVNAQKGKSITAEQAGKFMQEANQIESVIWC